MVLDGTKKKEDTLCPLSALHFPCHDEITIFLLFKINKKSKKNKASQPFSCLPTCLRKDDLQTKRRQITIFIMLRTLILLHFKFYLTVWPGNQFIIGPSYFRLFSMFLLSLQSLDMTSDNAQISR